MSVMKSNIKNQISKVWKHLVQYFIWFFNTPKVMLKTLGILFLMHISFQIVRDLWFDYTLGTPLGLAFVRPVMVMFLAIDYVIFLELIVLYGLIHHLARRSVRILVIRWILEMIALVFLMYAMYWLSMDVVLMRLTTPIDYIKQIALLFYIEFKSIIELQFQDGFDTSLGLGFLLFNNRLLISLLIPTGVFIHSLVHRAEAQQRTQYVDAIAKKHEVVRAQHIIRKYGGPKPTFSKQPRRYRALTVLGYYMYQVAALLIVLMAFMVSMISYNLLGAVLAILLFGLVASGLYVLGRQLVRRNMIHLSTYVVMKIRFELCLDNFLVTFIGIHLALTFFYAYRLQNAIEALYFCLIVLGASLVTLINGVRLIIKIKADQVSFAMNPIEDSKDHLLNLES